MARTGFTRKKVESLTLGEKLQRIRHEYRITLHEVAKNTKIQVKYLEYLERGEYEKLPYDVYVRGFLRSYAGYLGANEAVLLKLYEKERNIRSNLKKEEFAEKVPRIFHVPRFAITPRLLISLLSVVLVGVAFGYLYREYQAFVSAPYLAVTEPLDGQVTQESVVWVRGKTAPEATLSLNTQPIAVQEDGQFAEPVQVQPGLNTLALVSVNKFHKEATHTLTIQADYALPSVAEESIPPPVPSPTKWNLELLATAADVAVSVTVDGVIVYNGKPDLGRWQVFEVEREARVSAGRGDRVLTRVGGGAEQLLDPKAGPVQDKIFTHSMSDTNNQQ